MYSENRYHDANHVLDTAIQGAHSISKKLFLYEAAKMSEEDIRTFLGENHIVDKEIQDKYIDYVYMYRIASL